MISMMVLFACFMQPIISAVTILWLHKVNVKARKRTKLEIEKAVKDLPTQQSLSYMLDIIETEAKCTLKRNRSFMYIHGTMWLLTVAITAVLFMWR